MPLIMDNLGVTFKNKKDRDEFFSERSKNYYELQKEINIPFRVDVAVFKKSTEEKVLAANLKRQFYGRR